MKIKRNISVALMLTYLVAMVLNAVVVLSCDCISCHAHVTTIHCSCGECPMEMDRAVLSQHCECTHSHENRAEVAVTVDSERVLKLTKVAVAELPRALACPTDATSISAHETPNCPLAVPLDDDPLLWAGGLRAPPVFA